MITYTNEIHHHALSVAKNLLRSLFISDRFHMMRIIGSMVINGEGDDVDVVVHVQPFSTEHFVPDQVSAPTGWVKGGDSDSGGAHDWTSFKFQSDKIMVNVLLTTDEDCYKYALRSCDVCKWLARESPTGKINKRTRTAIHQIIMDEAPWGTAGIPDEEIP